MVPTHSVREQIRQQYAFRCGYCGVSEEEVGNFLEVDHFFPISLGGTDDPANLVYCCSSCNRYKGNFWADPESSMGQRLLHPQRDDLNAHLREEADGRLIALSETGEFHLERLQLNRPPLVAQRLARHKLEKMQDELAQAQEVQKKLRRQVESLSAALQRVMEQLRRLTDS
jgi:hypothetical protein